MKKSEKFLFFYSIIAVTVVFLASAFFSPTPLNLILGIALLPILFYFWIRLTSPTDTNVSTWSIRLVIVVAALGGLGMLAYYLSIQSGRPGLIGKQNNEQVVSEKLEELANQIKSLKSDDASGDKLLKELTIIREELARLQLKESTLGSSSESLSEILLEYEEDSIVNTPLGYVTIKDSENTFINAYAEPNKSSKVEGQIVYGQKYPYFEIEGSWYQVKLSEDAKAWVSADNVKEVSNN